MPKFQDPLMPTAEAARVLGVDVRTVHRLVERDELVAAGKTPGLRGAFLFDPSEVERVREQRQAEPAA